MSFPYTVEERRNEEWRVKKKAKRKQRRPVRSDYFYENLITHIFVDKEVVFIFCAYGRYIIHSTSQNSLTFSALNPHKKNDITRHTFDSLNRKVQTVGKRNCKLFLMYIFSLFCFLSAEFRHNPYVGTFHRTSGGASSISSSYLPINSPHVGTFRHAPSAGLKEVIKEDKPIRRNFISNIQISQRVSCIISLFFTNNV